VTFLVYAQTLQADALGLIAAKVRSALTMEGELPENGLAALEGDNHDVFLALARRLIEPDGADGPSSAIGGSTRRAQPRRWIWYRLSSRRTCPSPGYRPTTIIVTRCLEPSR
jgi:hypothetical protein